MFLTTVLLVLWIGSPAPHDPAPLTGLQAGEGEPQGTALQHQEPRTALQPIATTPSADPTVSPSPPRKQGKIDLNRATVEELQHLPGIGPVLAQRVVEQRTTHGPFQAVDDLSKVKGIGQKRMDQLRPLVMVDMVGKPEAKRDAKKAKTL